MSEPVAVPVKPASPAAPPASPPSKAKIPIGLIAGVIAMLVVLFMPMSDALPVAGHRMLAILVFAVVVWITEAVSYEASAIMITTLMQQAALDQVKALNADKQSLSTRLAAADKAPHGPANDAAAPKNEPPEMAAIVAAYRLQADKDNAQLRMKEDEIELLRTQLSVQSKTRSGESAAAKLSASGEQQAYAIGASMGSEALNVLTTRRTQGVTVDADLVLQGIEDAFRGQLRLGEQERNKALFDVSQQVFQNLNKIEQKNISAGKKYQQAFARKKDVVFKEGVYSRVDYPGKGKISGNDLVTVVIKEMLTDGTVINDMEAKDQALTQKLDAYPPVFREPLKRLQNHGSVTLVVPPEKAYGSKGLPPKIPPGATMVYSVRIVDSQPEPAK